MKSDTGGYQEGLKLIPGFVTAAAMMASYTIAKEIGFTDPEALIIMLLIFAANMSHGLAYVVVEYLEPEIENEPQF